MTVAVLLILLAVLAVGAMVLAGVVASRIEENTEVEGGEDETSRGWISTYFTGWRMASELGLGWLMVLWTWDMALIVLMLLGFCGYDLLGGSP